MGFFKSRKGSIISDYFLLKKDISGFRAGYMYDVALYPDHLSILSPSKSELTLLYSQITDVYYGIDKEITTKNKSVIGRAAAGGLLFGGTGAVIGAISGSGQKQVVQNHTLMIISFTSSDGGLSFLEFEDTRNYKGYKLCGKLEELCGLKKSRRTTTAL